MTNAPDFIDIDIKSDKELLIQKYETETNTTLYPAQDAMIMINLIAYYGNLVKTQVNDAAKLNLVEYSRAPILDFLGKYKNCERTSASTGTDTLKIMINTVFSYDVTISKGYQVKSSDGAYIFETTKDLIISSGDTKGEVEIESLEATSEVNNYTAGEINTIMSNAYSFIESVENLYGVTGGSDEESDENYIQRILLAPESYSVAGPELAYIYFAKSAHSSIVDVKVDIPSDDITVDINGETLTMTEDEQTNDNFSVSTDYQEGEVNITLNNAVEAGSTVKVNVPHPYKINLYVLTDEGEASESVLESVETALETVRPLVDYVKVNSAVVEDFEISGTVYLIDTADEDTVTTNVNNALNDYLSTVKNSLNKSVVINKIITAVCGVEGVYNFELTSFSEDLEAKTDTYYSGSIGDLVYERTDYDN
ncbi:MAG: baseplate J/gp47 family protein [Candidatus Gastranaerophilales bacterium]|nr:baseplate J/gp47 family protein [Candidatus Gastranaerophilales bacterium]